MSRYPLDSPLGSDLRKLEDKIRDGDRVGIEARWEFGRRLVRYRGDAKQLPNGLTDAIVEAHGISASELRHRMRFAEKYPTKDEVSTVVETYASWTAVRDALYDKRTATEEPPAADLDAELAELVAEEGETSFDTREAWLQAVVTEVRPLFGDTPPPETVYVSVGEVPGSQEAYCTRGSRSEDGTSHIFVGAHMDDEEFVAATLVHELCHAALPDGVRHGPEFKKLAESVGLEGPMTSTVAGDQLKELLSDVVARVGPYPHVALKQRPRPAPRRTTYHPELWDPPHWERFSTEVWTAVNKVRDALLYWGDPNFDYEPDMSTISGLSVLHEALAKLFNGGGRADDPPA